MRIYLFRFLLLDPVSGPGDEGRGCERRHCLVQTIEVSTVHLDDQIFFSRYEDGWLCDLGSCEESEELTITVHVAIPVQTSVNPVRVNSSVKNSSSSSCNQSGRLTPLAACP